MAAACPCLAPAGLLGEQDVPSRRQDGRHHRRDRSGHPGIHGLEHLETRIRIQHHPQTVQSLTPLWEGRGVSKGQGWCDSHMGNCHREQDAQLPAVAGFTQLLTHHSITHRVWIRALQAHVYVAADPCVRCASPECIWMDAASRQC